MGDDKIREGLLQVGWPESDINEAMVKAPAGVAPQPRPKAMMSKSLAVIFTVIAIAVAGYFAGAYYMSKFQNFPLWPFEAPVMAPTFTPRPSPANLEVELPSDISADWKTYRNEGYGFEFRYPGDFKILFEKYDQYNHLVVLKKDQQQFEVRIIKRSISLDKYWYLDTPIDSTGTLGDKQANIYKSTGYCDGPGCGPPFITYVAEVNNDFYHMTFYGDQALSKTENQILSTFKFIE